MPQPDIAAVYSPRVRAGKNTVPGCAFAATSIPRRAHICAIEVPTALSPGSRSLVKLNTILKPFG